MSKPLSRRELLAGASLLAASALTGFPTTGSAQQTGDRPRAEAARKLKVVVTGGHPGDPEYGCGGTIARFSSLGHEVTLLYLNHGDPKETPDAKGPFPRVTEAERACNILKARPVFAGQIDGNAVVDRTHYEVFRRLLTAEKPDVVFTHWPIDHHADHRAMSMLVYDAWLHLRKSFALFYYEVSNGEDTVQFSPTDYLDISEVESRKRAACFAHASQNPEKYYKLQETVARMRGIESGHGYAEAFIRHLQSPVFDLPRG